MNKFATLFGDRRKTLVISNATRRIFFFLVHLFRTIDLNTHYIHEDVFFLIIKKLFFYKMKFQLISKYVNNATIHWKRSYFILNQQTLEYKNNLHIIFFLSSSSIIWSRFSTQKFNKSFFCVQRIHTPNI